MNSANTIENQAHDLALFPYIGRLDLEQAPFNANASGQFFFSDPSIKQYLNLLRHLTQSSNLIPVVLSPKGGGKSSLLQAFIEQSDENSRVCIIDASHAGDKSYILKELAIFFDIHNEADEQSLLQLFHQKTIALHEDSRYPVIAIENAQHLQDDACKLLLLLQQGIEDRVNTWHVLFFADCIEGKAPKLYNINLSEYPQLYILLIEPFTLEQTKNYISHRLMAAGYKGECPLTEASLRYIHLQSNGLPGKINELAHRALLKISTPSLVDFSELHAGVTASSTNHFSSFRVILLGSLLVFGIAAIIYLQDDINAIFNVIDQPQILVDEKNINQANPDAVQKIEPYPVKQTSKSIPEKSVVQENPGPTKQNGSEESIKESMDTKTPANFNAHVNPTFNKVPSKQYQAQIADKQNITEKQTAHMDTVTTQTKEDQPGIVSKSVSPMVDITPQKQVSDLKISPYERVLRLLPASVHREDWLLRQQGQYTVQLIGTFDEKMLANYINESLSGNTLDHEMGYYMISSNGENKHTLIYGIFSTYYQARQAIIKLPKTMKSNGPWPVKLDDVRKNISSQMSITPVIEKSPGILSEPTVQRSEIKINENPDSIKDGSEWIPNKNPDFYTIQLLSSSNKKTLLDYMYKYKVQDGAVLYKTTRNKKDWYILFYGAYETRSKAQSVVNSLPDKARSNDPWIRNIGDLQKQTFKYDSQ